MAFSFKVFINKIKEGFTPKTYMNVDTGEIIKKREFKKLSPIEQEEYITVPNKPKEKELPKGVKIFKRKPPKKYKDIKPPAPPKKVTKDLEERMLESLSTFDSIESLKRRIQEIERKNPPIFDLTTEKNILLNIIEDNENISESYQDYLLKNEEEISTLINQIEYHGSTQEQIQGYITNLYFLLNQGVLSPSDEETLSYISDNMGWENV